MYNIRSLVCDVYWKWQHCHNNHHNCARFWIDVTNKHFHASSPNGIDFDIVESFYFLFSFIFLAFFSTIGLSHALPFSARSLLEIDIAFKVFIAFLSRFSHTHRHTGIDIRENETILNEMACQNHQHFILHKKCVSWYRFHHIYFVAAAFVVYIYHYRTSAQNPFSRSKWSLAQFIAIRRI